MNKLDETIYQLEIYHGGLLLGRVDISERDQFIRDNVPFASGKPLMIKVVARDSDRGDTE